MSAVAEAALAPPRRAAPPGGAIVLGADYRALGVVRSLGRRGIPVWVLREPEEPLAAFSRYARRTIPWARAGADRVGFLIGLARDAGAAGWALIPTSDGAAALIARHHAALGEWFALTSPAWETLRWAYDKRRTYELAARLGIDHPRSGRPGEDIRFPAIIKPAFHRGHNRLTAAKAWRVDDAAQLARRWADACELMDPDELVVQELVPGGGGAQLSYTALCHDGRPLASLTARRARQYPADFGRASTYVETIDCPDVVGPSERLVAALGWTGLIEVEYKRDARDGAVKLLDVNPRVWGWQTLCGRAGVDYPYLLWRRVSGQPVPAVRARPGVGWLRLSTDTPTALRELAHGRLAARPYLRSLARRHEAAIFAWDDPLPGVLELPVLLSVLGRRLARGRGV